MSFIKLISELSEVITEAKKFTSKYEKGAVYTIINVESITFDSHTKEIASDWMKEGVAKKCFIVGAMGVRKIMIKAVIKLSGRDFAVIARDVEEA